MIINDDGGYGLLASSRLAWSKGRRPPGAMLYSSHEPSELLQWLCYDDSTMIIIIIVPTWAIRTIKSAFRLKNDTAWVLYHADLRSDWSFS